MLLRRHIYTETPQYEDYEEDIIRSKLENSRDVDGINNRLTRKKGFLKGPNKIDRYIDKSYRTSNNRLQKNLIPYKASSGDIDSTDDIIKDIDSARKNVDKYRDAYSRAVSDVNKKALSLTGGAIGAIVSRTSKNPSAMGAKGFIKNVAIGSGGGYLASTVTDNYARKKGRELGEKMAISDGHGDRTREKEAIDKFRKKS